MKAVGLFLLVLAGKGAAVLMSSGFCSFTPAERGVVLGLTVPQAAATLAVTLLGFEKGLFESSDVNAVILMILLTCLVGPGLVLGREVAG